MGKRIELTPEQRKASAISMGIKDMEEKFAWGILSLKPTRQFNIGDRVRYGSMEEVYVRQIYREGLYYQIECIGVKRNRDKPPEDEIHITEWHDLVKYDQARLPYCHTQEEKYYIRLLNSGIQSLLHMVYHAGVDFDVEYQREHVWKLEDKVALIDSIFNNIDIGKFVFAQRDFGFVGKLYEIIDGKQRLTTLCEFFEDRFQYKGNYFSELSFKDQNKFENYGITYGYLEQPTKEAILETFVKLNTCGKPMAHKHLDLVKDMLNDLKGEKNG